MCSAEIPKTQVRRVQMISLILLGLTEIITMIGGEDVRGDRQFFLISLTNLAAGLFLAASFLGNDRAGHEKMMTLGLVFCGWFFIIELAELRHLFDFSYMGPRFARSTFLCEYAMCLPFAAMTEDGEEKQGLKILSGCYLAYFGVAVLLTAAIYLGIIPEGTQGEYGWKGTRLLLNEHPNLVAIILMICMGFSIAWAFQSRKVQVKVACWAAVLVQCFMITLTNCRTVVIMACCILGGVVFFLLYRNVTRKNLIWKFILSLTAAILSIAVLFMASTMTYQYHCSWTVEKTTEVEEQQTADASPETELAEQQTAADAQAAEQEKEAAAQDLLRASGQGTLLTDIGHFNGRTGIWVSAVRHAFEEPGVLLFGTRNIDDFVSLHNSFHAAHAHNSWIQVMLELGVVGLCLALCLTFLAVDSCLKIFFFRESTMFQKTVGLLVFGIMGAEFFESYLFYAPHPYNYINLPFLFCLGYLVLWAAKLPRRQYL